MEASSISPIDLNKIFTNTHLFMAILQTGTGTILSINPAFLQALGMSVGETTGKTVPEIGLVDDSIYRIMKKQLKETGSIPPRELILKTPERGTITLMFSAQRVSMGEQPAVFALAQDISAMKLAERELFLEQKEVRETHRIKSSFLANVNHELRTPLNGIMGMLNLIDDSTLTSENKKYLGYARDSAEKLFLIIKDLLDLSQINLKQVQLSSHRFDVFELIRHIIMSLETRIKTKKLQVEFIPEKKEGWFFTDEARLCQILYNLISNSIKYSEDGTIRIRASIDPDLKITIQDEGIGISPDQITRIFEPFYQIEDPYTKKHGGLGTGLSIVKNLLELMGGRIKVQSTLEEGTEFSICLPYEPNECSDEKKQVGKKTVLIVEDDAINRLYLQSIVEKYGYETLMGEDGLTAVELFRENRPALVLMDIGLPKLSGDNAIRRIREGELDSRTPILAVTAHTSDQDLEAIRRAGANDFIRKPFIPARIREALERYIPKKDETPPGP